MPSRTLRNRWCPHALIGSEQRTAVRRMPAAMRALLSGAALALAGCAYQEQPAHRSPHPQATVTGWQTAVATEQPPATPVTTASLARGPEPVRKPDVTGHSHAMFGIASYYWQAQATSSGETFDRNGFTAAHRTLPFNTRVRVTNIGNGKSVVVRINDRGPFKPGRVIDLSEAAAKAIAMTGQGLAQVRVEVLR